MFNLEESITLWLKSFQKHPAYDEASIYEMELHLRDHIDDLKNEGYDESEAFEKAVVQFGNIPSVAEEEYSNKRRKRTVRSILYSTLFKNYSKTSLRSMMRNPLSSFINLVGLAAAIGICVFTYAFAQWTYRTDQFHEHKNEVFLATFFAEREGSLQQNGRSPRPLGEILKKDFVQIQDICRIQMSQAVVKYGDKVFHQKISFVDASYLEFFTFPLKQGVISALEDVNSVIISEGIAKKYFGDHDPIGQNLLLKFDENTSKTFVVAGVAEKFPPSRSFNFSFLINYENLEVAYPDFDSKDWGSFVDATFVKVTDKNGLDGIPSQMDKYRLLQNESGKDWQVASFSFEPFATLAQRSATIRNTINVSTEEGTTAIIYLVFVGVFMLLLACFNYINIAIVSAARRLKEIGIRKTIGASKKVIIVQFLSENLIATALALVLGLLLGSYLFIPWFESLFYFSMGFTLLDSSLWIYLVVILLITALVSGLYPAFYISRFPVTGILKGSVKFGKKNRLTKLILGFQLVLSCMFITCAIMFTQNSQYLANRSWGYNEDQSLYAQVDDLTEYKLLKSALSQEAAITGISGSKHHIGETSHSTLIQLAGQDYEVDQLEVDANYLNVMDITLLNGRMFHSDPNSDKYSVIVNEQFANKIFNGEALEQGFKLDSNRYTIIGIAKDFHTYNFEKAIAPTFFTLADPTDFRFLSMRVKEGRRSDAYQSLQKIWSDLFPETPFLGGYQEDVWGMYFVEIGIHGKVWRGIASIAIILASLGLYGLVTLNVSGRVKEFSIRKVLGAGIKDLWKNMLHHFLWLFIIALIIGAPLSYYLTDLILDAAYKYRVPSTVNVALIAVAILFSVLLLVVATQLSRVRKSNPVEGLQTE